MSHGYPKEGFNLVGSWDDWKSFVPLSRSGQSGSFVARVPIRRPPGLEEFQILQGQDWAARYYPTARGEGVEGPGNAHGRNFRVTPLPADCMQLEILWDVLGRKVTWKFLNATEQEIPAGEKKVAAKKGAKARSEPRTRTSNRGPFFLVGSWDNWKGFAEFLPFGDSFRTKVKVGLDMKRVEFQVVVARDWNRRFHPTSSGDGLAGPDVGHGLNWRAEVGGKKWLEVTWSPDRAPYVEWTFPDPAEAHEAAAEDFAAMLRALAKEGSGSWFRGMAGIFEALPKCQRSSPYGGKAENEATARCLLATFLRDLETMADPLGPAPGAQRGALKELEEQCEQLLKDTVGEIDYAAAGGDFMQEALPVDPATGPVQLKLWHRLVYLPLVMYVRNTVHLYEMLERLKAQASGAGQGRLRALLDAKGTARESPYSWLVFSIVGALQTLYHARAAAEKRGGCDAFPLELLASSPPQTVWIQDGVEWSPSHGSHAGAFQRKQVVNCEPMKPLGTLRKGDGLMYRGIWLPADADEDTIRYQYSFQSFSRSIEGVMRVLRFYSGVASTKAGEAARAGHILMYIGRDYASSPWVTPVQLFDGPKRKAGDSEQELLLPPFIAYEFEEEYSVDSDMELPEKQMRIGELEESWGVRLPEHLTHFVYGLLPHLNNSQVSSPAGGFRVSLRFLRRAEPAKAVSQLLQDTTQLLYRWSAEEEKGAMTKALKQVEAEFYDTLLRQRELQRKQENSKCHGCALKHTHYEQLGARRSLAADIEDLDRELGAESLGLLPQLRAKEQVLRDLQCLDEDGLISFKGQAATEVLSGDEITVAEVVFRNILESHTPEEVAAAVTAFVFPDKVEMPEDAKMEELPESLAMVRQAMLDQHYKVEQLLVKHRAQYDSEEFMRSCNVALMGTAYRWACGETFANIMQESPFQEGAIVRAIVRAEELLRKLQEVAKMLGNSVLQNVFSEAADLIHRDIAFVPSLYIKQA
ncbi:SKI2 [Symbiodinium sp. CCMP2456]|nr:SKI2 [Symbiodinium sp. CCMP2456]